MSHGSNTADFLEKIPVEAKNEILDNIANHYGIKRDAALVEVTDPEAEHLLDYVTGPTRGGVDILMTLYRSR